MAGAAVTLVAFLIALISLCKGTHRKHYRMVAVFLFTAGKNLVRLTPVHKLEANVSKLDQ